MKPSWMGPALVLAQEPSRSERRPGVHLPQDGPVRPGSVVWVVLANRLIRAAPEHLREASTLERADLLKLDPNFDPGTTLEQCTARLQGGQYEGLLEEPSPPPGQLNTFGGSAQPMPEPPLNRDLLQQPQAPPKA